MIMVFIKNFGKTQIQKDTFSFLFAWESAKQIPIWNYPSDNYNLWNLKFSSLNQSIIEINQSFAHNPLA